MAELNYRPWREGDDRALNEIWSDAPSAAAAGRELFRPASDTPWSRTIVAEDQGIPVAAGVVGEASVHPERLWAYVEVAKDHRQAGVGSTLLAMLRREAAAGPQAGKPLRAKVATGSAGAAFAASAGLKPIQRSRIVRVRPGALRLGGLAEDSGQQVEDLATGSVELTRALWDFYTAVHTWDPPADLGLGRVNQLFLSEGAGAHGAVVLREQGAIKAFAISYSLPAADAPEDAAADVLLGYDTTAPGTEAAVEKLLALLVHRYPVELELDDSMTALAAVVDPLIAAGTADVLSETLVVSE
ncbi:GNAT family N-acetyltransferase [Paenarthrobacter sp. DKR-5]|uniref:GNAT family N-acetyltransferase n=1 Tax=Paenarthrobacter sp. DKR-5 TaxID=2835535 RepID=UPI001BDD847A|nr:GNAT family N-acetyltransferase [Paenarthrobacter sp. DKR-5]MBT1002609.1 GNAT family N-acetyltransferase [Paenarthrobacter sp. DKR-5]